jgi:hypothetical protein
MVTINRKFTCTVPIPNNWTGDKFRCREIPSIDPEKRPKTLVSTISSNFFSFLICTVVCRGIENPTEWNHTYLCFITFAKRFFLLFFYFSPQFLFYYFHSHSSPFFFLFTGTTVLANNAHWDEQPLLLLFLDIYSGWLFTWTTAAAAAAAAAGSIL